MKNKRVPKLRFPEFMGEWYEVELGDICNIVGGGTPDTSIEDYWNGNINWFTPSEIGKSKYAEKSIRKITEKGLSKSSAKLLPIGSILYSSRATIGEMSILRQEACTNQGFQSLVVNDLINNEFVYYCNNDIKKQSIKNASGSTFLEISKNQVSKIKITIPDYKEQTCIAEFLTVIDQKIETQEQIISKLETIKKGYLQKIFSQEIRFKDQDGNEFPEWEEILLNELGVFFTGGSLSKDNISDFGEPCILYGQLFTTYNEAIYNVISKTKSENLVYAFKNDILFPTSTTVNAISLITPSSIEVDKVALGGDIIGFRPKKNIIGKFLSYQINQDVIKREFAKNAQGSTIIHIYKDGLKNSKVKIACYDEQKKIAEFLTFFDQKIEIEKQKIEKWKQIKKGLLQQMFV